MKLPEIPHGWHWWTSEDGRRIFRGLDSAGNLIPGLFGYACDPSVSDGGNIEEAVTREAARLVTIAVDEELGRLKG